MAAFLSCYKAKPSVCAERQSRGGFESTDSRSIQEDQAVSGICQSTPVGAENEFGDLLEFRTFFFAINNQAPEIVFFDGKGCSVARFVKSDRCRFVVFLRQHRFVFKNDEDRLILPFSEISERL